MTRPPEAFGDPKAEMCRWCESGKRHIRGGLFCTRCDSGGDGTTTILATRDPGVQG